MFGVVLRRKGNHEVVKCTEPMWAKVIRAPRRGSWLKDVRIRSIPPMSWLGGHGMLVTLDEGVRASPMGIWLGV